MAEVDIELFKLQQDAALRKEEIQADVKKVVYGTLLLGIAVAFFPVVSGSIEHYFNLRVEDRKLQNSLELQANQLALDLERLNREGEIARETARLTTEQSDRGFFEAISDEARSARLSDRITIAEFFAFVARDESERARWNDFLRHLRMVQSENNTRRAELLLIIGDNQKSQSEREAAARELSQIDERENGVASGEVASRWLLQIPIPDKSSLGIENLSFASNSRMIDLFGRPHSNPTNECQLPDSEDMLAFYTFHDVGPFKARLFGPAAESLKTIFQEVSRVHPDLYAELNLLGAYCLRLSRGSFTQLSNHSWGTAIDLSIGGVLDFPGDQKAAAGLVELARFFAAEGWIWGGASDRDDSMHFEVSGEKLAEWEASGLLPIVSLPAEGTQP
jgi:hypothetical protein